MGEKMQRKGGRIRCGSGRAQVSLEFLILFAAFLAFLLVWIPLINNFKKASEFGIGVRYAELFISDLKNSVNEVCVLGSGNKRIINMNIMGNGILYAENKSIFLFLEVNGEEKTFEERVKCEVELNRMELNGKMEILVENEENIIKIRKIY